MNLFGITSLMTFFASIGFALSLYSGNRESKVNKSWLWASIAIAFWSLGLYGVTSSQNEISAFRWQYLLDVSASFIPVLYFIFVSTLVSVKNERFRKISLFLSLAMAFFSFSSLFKTSMVVQYGFYWVNPGKLYMLFPIFFTAYILFSIYFLIRKYIKEKDPKFRAQVGNALLGGVIGFGGGITNFFPQIMDVYPFGNYLILLYVFFMSYGVLRYKLFSAKIVSAQLLSGAIVLVFLFNIFRAETISDWILWTVSFVFVAIFSILLVKGVYKEVELREKTEILAKELKKSNEQLEVLNTSLAKVNTDLGKANDRLKELDQLKSEFVSLATHQIRGPLTAIKGYASMIIEGDYGEVSEKVKNAVSVILQSSVSLVLMVGDFLDVSRIEQGRMKFNFTVFDLKNLAKDVIKDLEPNIKRTGLSFDFVCDESKEYLVDADLVKIKQVAGNLIDNSIKYTQKGGIIVKVEKMANKDGDKIRFSVKDTGVGVPKELMPKLFEKFSRAENANEVNIIGTGLGLYLAKEMINAHGGKIWVESEGNEKGSTFIFELDAVKD